MNRISDFMNELGKELVSKKNITESSAILYMKNLFLLNNKQAFNNLSFLKNTSVIDEILKEYKDNTKKTILSSIVSVLSLYKDKPTYKKIYEHYYDLMMDKATEMKNNNINEKSKTQEDNWITWDDVLNAKAYLKEAIKTFENQKLITPTQFDILLAYMVLSLYSDIPPRRNQDYMDMYFVPSFNETIDKDKNYLDWNNKEFIFLHYKTAKKYGKQTINFNDNKELLEAITTYLKFHPLNPTPLLKKIPKNAHFKFLVYSDGSPLIAVNSITRILNKIFGKKVGSSMLRHIYLSSKYNISDMKNDAEMMGHSLNEQRQYIKEDNIETDTEEININTLKKQTPKPKPKSNLSKGNKKISII